MAIPERRKYDNMSDHDLIVAHTIKIDSLCKLIKERDVSFETFMTKFENRCARTHDKISTTHSEVFGKIDKKTDNTMFRWLIAIVITVMLAMAGTVGTSVIMAASNTKDIEAIQTDITDLKRGPGED